MNDAEVIGQASVIFASEIWWKPITRFFITNCAKFTGKHFTNEEHACFLSFRALLTDLFDMCVYQKLGLKPAVLEAAFARGVRSCHPQAAIVTDILRNYTDFAFFRAQMAAMGARIEANTVDCVVDARDAMGEDEALDIAALLEAQDRKLLETETEAKCAEYRERLSVKDTAVAVLRPKKGRPPLPPSAGSPVGSAGWRPGRRKWS
jgi:hypothetical protein